MKKYYLPLIFIILILFQIGCIDINKNDNYDFLKIEIIPLKNLNYSVIIPIPMLNDNISILVKECNFIKGNGYLEYNQTEKGIGLKIQSNGPLIIKNKIKNNYKIELYNRFTFPKKIDYFYDSGYEGDFYTFIPSHNNNTINIKIYCSSLSLGTQIWGETESSGWNEIYGHQARTQK